MSLRNRYADAYLVAQTINATGQTVKLVGFFFAALVTLAGFVAASRMGAIAFFAGLLFGLIVALPFYALGVMVSAQGQILKATLDSAVNTSPLLTQDEIRSILTGVPIPAVISRADSQSSHAPLGTIDSTDIVLPLNSPPPQPVAKRSCPHCGGALELGVSRCRWCMKKV